MDKHELLPSIPAGEDSRLECTEAIPPARLARLLSVRRLAHPIEERPLLGARLDDLDLSRLDAYFHNRFRKWTRPADCTATLLTHKLAADTPAGLRPTHLGILLFADQPDRHLSCASIDVTACRHARTDAHALDRRRITGPLPEQIGQIVRYFAASDLISPASPNAPEGRRHSRRYALKALQEAVVNAVAHRDYEARGAHITIRVFPDRVEFQNPGRLCDTLTLENLYAGCHPAQRNPFLAGFLRDYKSPLTGARYMDARGEGFLNLVRDSQQLSGRRPDLEQLGHATRLTIYAATHPD